MLARKLSFIMFAIVVYTAGAFAQTTSFTYQGQLEDSSSPATGSYDMTFALYDALAGGAQIGAAQAENGVAVDNGLFTVTLDFGESPFAGSDR